MIYRDGPNYYMWLADRIGVEPRWICNEFPWAVGNALEYIFRSCGPVTKSEDQHGRIQDLEKAKDHIQFQIDAIRMEPGQDEGNGAPAPSEEEDGY